MSAPTPVNPDASLPLWRLRLRRFLQSRWTFGGLQVLDLITTLVAFHYGAFEVNPLVAHLTGVFGRTGGVFMSKVMAVILAMGIQRRLWVINLFYVGVVFWNAILLVVLSSHAH